MNAPELSQPETVHPAQRICGWCRLELAPGTQPATYAICPRCYVRLEQDAKWHEERRDVMADEQTERCPKCGGESIFKARVRAPVVTTDLPVAPEAPIVDRWTCANGHQWYATDKKRPEKGGA